MEIVFRIIATSCLVYSSFKGERYIKEKNIAGVIYYGVWMILFGTGLMWG